MVRQAMPGLCLPSAQQFKPRKLVTEGCNVHNGHGGRAPMSTLQEKILFLFYSQKNQASVSLDHRVATQIRIGDSSVFLPGSIGMLLSVLR